MSLSSGLYSYLIDQAAISALVDTRIYPAILPQEPTLPAITYQIDGLEDRFTLEAGQTGPVIGDVQIDAWGSSHKAAADLSALIVTALRNLKGDMGGVTVQGLFRDTQIDIYEPTVEAYRRSIAFTIWHTE